MILNGKMELILIIHIGTTISPTVKDVSQCHVEMIIGRIIGETTIVLKNSITFVKKITATDK